MTQPNEDSDFSGDYEDLLNRILEDPATSYWLRAALKALETRDPMDMEHDAYTLAFVARKRAELLQCHAVARLQQNDGAPGST